MGSEAERKRGGQGQGWKQGRVPDRPVGLVELRRGGLAAVTITFQILLEM